MKGSKKKKILIIVAVILVIGIIGSAIGGKKADIKVADFSAMTQEEVKTWCDDNKVKSDISTEYSDSVAAGTFISQDVAADEKVAEGDTIKVVYSKGPKPSQEYLNALEKAKSYSDNLYMSKQGIYDQLVSQYGEKFPADAAQYAIDNLEADFNSNALHKAKTYQEMNMSKSAIYDQLISQYGEQFTAEEAQYAIDNLEE